MGMHTGEPRVVAGDYVGIDVHYAARICSAAHGGQVVVSEATAALIAHQPVEGVALQGLGEHRLKDLTRPVRLYQVAAEGLVATFPPLRAVGRPSPDALGRWAAPTALFGREADVAEVTRLLGEARCRLVTLVGPGGVGKTRLAIAAAARLDSEFVDGARVVALASIVEQRALASAIARALAAPIGEGESSRSAVLRFLADRHLLLVLDNFEQLVEGAPLIGEVLSACPGVTVLITSREPARLAAERLYPVRPLAVPGDASDAAATDIERYPSVAMFVDRARARNPGFAIDRTNGFDVCEICRRLDGLPLALELAAARIGVLAPGELASRLDRALGVLVGGTRDAPDRQRTLRAALDWSFELLTDDERRTFARMGVFPAGATVAVAEAVTEASLETLESLVAKQLLVRHGDRLMMLETVREYAGERLADDRDADGVRTRLADWCGQFVRLTTPDLRGAQRARSLARLDAELPNVFAVLSWALETRRAESMLRLVGDLGDYWWSSSRWEEGLRWLNAALSHAGSASEQARAKALLARARCTDAHRSFEQHHRDLEAGLTLFRASGDTAGIAACLTHLAWDEAWCGHADQAEMLADEAVQAAQRAGDERVLALALSISAIVASGYDTVVQRAVAAVRHLETVGDLVALVRVCGNVGYLATVERRYDDALSWLDRGEEFARRLESQSALFFIRTNRGLARLFLDDFDEAGQDFRDALVACRDGSKDVIDETLLGLAAVEAEAGDLERAAHLAGAAEALETAERSADEDAIWDRLHDAILTAARLRYGPENWDRAAHEGAALDVQEAIDLALAHRLAAHSAVGGTGQIS
jgi:predicted ATPase